MLGDARGQGRRHVQHVLAPGNGFPPTRVVYEIGGEEGQAIARLSPAFPQQSAHVALALQAAYGGAHLMPRGQQLQNGMASDEARPAGNKNCAHPASLIFDSKVPRATILVRLATL